MVERSGLSLSALFALHGESYYRQVEHQCLMEVFAREKPLVLATGGGIVEHLESYDLLLRHTVTVWLDARADRLWERVVGQGDERPDARASDGSGSTQLVVGAATSSVFPRFTPRGDQRYRTGSSYRRFAEQLQLLKSRSANRLLGRTCLALSLSADALSGVRWL